MVCTGLGIKAIVGFASGVSGEVDDNYMRPYAWLCHAGESKLGRNSCPRLPFYDGLLDVCMRSGSSQAEACLVHYYYFFLLPLKIIIFWFPSILCIRKKLK